MNRERSGRIAAELAFEDSSEAEMVFEQWLAETYDFVQTSAREYWERAGMTTLSDALPPQAREQLIKLAE